METEMIEESNNSPSEVTGRTIGDALYEFVRILGCFGLLLLMGTCAGCWTVAGLGR